MKMKVESAKGATGWRLIGELAMKSAVVNAGTMLLFFTTSLGNWMPDWFKISAPICLWIVTMAFFIIHRTPDKKGVEYRIW